MFGAGEFNRFKLKVLLVPEANAPQPLAAAIVKVIGIAVVALPPAVELKVTQAGLFAVVVSIVNGVPPVVAEATEMVCAGPGV